LAKQNFFQRHLAPLKQSKKGSEASGKTKWLPDVSGSCRTVLKGFRGVKRHLAHLTPLKQFQNGSVVSDGNSKWLSEASDSFKRAQRPLERQNGF